MSKDKVKKDADELKNAVHGTDTAPLDEVYETLNEGPRSVISRSKIYHV